jgi:hypothetical protein
MSVRRLLPLFVLLYITADFIDPAAPGVFFFDNDAFFVDGVVQLKSHTPRDLTPMEPVPIAGLVESEREIRTATVRVIAQPFLRSLGRWRALKHDDSSPDASATPPSA